MIRVTVFVGLALCALAASAEPISRRAPMASGGELEVSNLAGSVTVTGWSRAEVLLEGELWEGADELRFDADGDRTYIEVEIDRKSKRVKGSRLEIHVPHDTDVTVGTVSADITVSGTRGSQQLQAVSGDIRTEIAGKDIEARSVSGNVEVIGNNSAINHRIAAVSGDLILRKISGNLDAGSVSGDITVDGSNMERVDLETVSGDIDADFNLVPSARVNVQTVSGTTRFDLGRVADIEFALESFSGDIDDMFDLSSARTGRHTPGRELRLVVGEARSRMKVETLSGDIIVRTDNNPRGEIRDLTSRRHGKHGH